MPPSQDTRSRPSSQRKADTQSQKRATTTPDKEEDTDSQGKRIALGAGFREAYDILSYTDKSGWKNVQPSVLNAFLQLGGPRRGLCDASKCRLKVYTTSFWNSKTQFGT